MDASGFPALGCSVNDYGASFAVSCLIDEKTDDMLFKWERNGYFWSFPKEDKTNCGYSKSKPPFDGVRRKTVSYSKGVGNVEKFSGGFLPYSFDGNLWNPEKRTVLIGDAAGLCNSFHGGGIHTALLSAQISADNIDNLERYEATLTGGMKEERNSAKVLCSFRENESLDSVVSSDMDIKEATFPGFKRKLSARLKLFGDRIRSLRVKGSR